MTFLKNKLFQYIFYYQYILLTFFINYSSCVLFQLTGKYFKRLSQFIPFFQINEPTLGRPSKALSI